jgi:cytochrome c-type biogenesis protein CcmH
VGGLVLALALGGYAWLGSPGIADQPLQGRLLAAALKKDSRPTQAQAEALLGRPFTPAPETDPALLELIERLRAAVAERPEDSEGLDLLARNEAAIGNFKGAYLAEAQLIAVLGDRAQSGDHAQLAGLMVLAAGGFVSPEAEAALVKALTLDRREPRARYLTGLLFAQNDRPDLAFRVWQPLLAESDPQAPWVGPIRAGIEEIAALAGLSYDLPPARGPSAADVAAAAEMSDEDREALIGGMVEGLATRLATEGGPAPDWARLIMSLGVLGQTDRARAIWDEARQVFAADPAGLAEIRSAAEATGVAE